MALTPGTRLGVYEVTAQIGEGGMGQVFRARDTKLDRDVAIKILPEAFAHDADRLARFQREAKTLASLNHPNIAIIHGLEQAGDVHALVMELVEGDDLSQRITRGAIPIDEALPIAKQIADALEAAHDQGIIHRDLKPANIKVRSDGTVKVLDFGLAKAMEPAAGPSPSVSQSPTITTPAMTQAGMILGTAAYMAPEQAKGRAADKRSDIWAFGCVLFEMLTGKRAFAGEDVSDALAFIITKEPDWNALPANTPAPIRKLLRGSLQKDRKERVPDIAVARLEIKEALATPAPEDTPAVRVAPKATWWRRALPWAVAAGALAVAGALLVLLAPWRTVPPSVPLRVNADLGVDASLATAAGPYVNIGTSIVLSPDGTLLAFVAQKDGAGTPQLYVRRLEQLQATPLKGTEEAASPFFSPDGQWIAFFAQGKLKKISVTGGAAVTLCDAANGRGGSWGEDGTIIFTPAQIGPFLWRVSSAGGTPEPLPKPGDGEVTQRWPQVLPGGKAVLYTGNTAVGGYEDANLVVQALPTGPRKIVQRGGYYGRYLRSGHLVYIHDGTLFAAPFDLARLELTGAPIPALEGVTSNPSIGSTQFAVSDTGTIVYLPGQSVSRDIPIHWMDRQGKMTPLRAVPSNWSDPAFAPDGRRLALAIFDGKQWDVWVYEWARDTLSRLTFDLLSDQGPVWTPDGRRIAFRSARGRQNLYWQRADGTGDVQRLTDSQNPQIPGSWHPSGKFLAFMENSPQTRLDLMILPMDGDETSGWKPGKPTVFLNSAFGEVEPMFSPDGRWLAYSSNETGQNQVYVRPFPGPGGKWQISTDGGGNPRWSRIRHELFYGAPDQRIMVASYSVEGDSFRAEKPRLWSEARLGLRGGRTFDLHPDGERFALAAVPETQTAAKQDKLVFIFNFFDELRRIAPSATR